MLITRAHGRASLFPNLDILQTLKMPLELRLQTVVAPEGAAVTCRFVPNDFDPGKVPFAQMVSVSVIQITDLIQIEAHQMGCQDIAG
jgi:hypothetical protein